MKEENYVSRNYYIFPPVCALQVLRHVKNDGSSNGRFRASVLQVHPKVPVESSSGFYEQSAILHSYDLLKYSP